MDRFTIWVLAAIVLAAAFGFLGLKALDYAAGEPAKTVDQRLLEECGKFFLKNVETVRRDQADNNSFPEIIFGLVTDIDWQAKQCCVYPSVILSADSNWHSETTFNRFRELEKKYALGRCVNYGGGD